MNRPVTWSEIILAGQARVGEAIRLNEEVVVVPIGWLRLSTIMYKLQVRAWRQKARCWMVDSVVVSAEYLERYPGRLIDASLRRMAELERAGQLKIGAEVATAIAGLAGPGMEVKA